MMRPKQFIQGVAWILLYMGLTFAPLLVLLFSERPAGREFWRELSVALGYVGLGMMALQFVLTARFRWLKAPYGSDIVYFFHRQISIVAFVLILAHPLMLFIFEPATLGLLNLLEAPWRARAAVTATVALIGVVGLSIWRQRLKLEYNRWRIWHGLLAMVAVSLALVHVVLVGHYINTPLKQALWVIYGVFWVGLLLYTRLLKPLWMLRTPYRVIAVTPERGGAWTLRLEPVGHTGLHFAPGQFAWLTAFASPFADAEHPFSFSSSAENKKEVAFTIKELGDFTARIKELQPGDTVYLDGAFGSFSVDRHPHAGGYIFIAGGVGITPVMSMLRTLADRGDQRPLLLIYANKTWDSVTFREEIDDLKGRLNLRVVHVLESPPENWQGEQGFITRRVLENYLPPEWQRNQQEIFICGPAPMMDAVERSLDAMGVWVGDFHSERFNMV